MIEVSKFFLGEAAQGSFESAPKKFMLDVFDSRVAMSSSACGGYFQLLFSGEDKHFEGDGMHRNLPQ